jgi:hypothetical protein
MTATRESERLRVIGQELEHRRAVDFDISIEEGRYRVSASGSPEPRRGSGLRGLFGRRDRGDETWQREFSGTELEWLNRQYRARRTRDGIPDDYATSQMLRVVGAYAEQCRWRLAGVSRSGHVIAIRYRDSDGVVRTSAQKYADLYDFSFHLVSGPGGN